MASQDGEPPALPGSLVRETIRRRDLRATLGEWAGEIAARSGYAPAPHHRLLLAELEALAHGHTDRLMVLMPPGSAKSTYGSVIFPAWWLARYPASSVIAASHTADLAVHFGRQVRTDLVEQGRRIGLELRPDNRAAHRWRVTQGGQYYAVGLRGPLTGRRGDLIVIDDPIKSQVEADSAAARELAWNWYRFTLLPRLTPQGRVVLIMTRWHEDDIAGRILSGGSGEWRVLRLPAIAEAEDALSRAVGDPLWPTWEDRPALDRRRETIGERAWSALYQLAPRLLDGGFFEVDRIGTVDCVPASGGHRVVRAWDLAATPKASANDPDWTVGLKLMRDTTGRYCILDVIRLRGSAWEVEEALRQTARRDGAHVGISLPQDPGAAGKLVVAHYIQALEGFSVFSSTETGSKLARATPVAAQIEAGKFTLLRGAWNHAFIEELRDFPQGRKDDQVDALSRAFARVAFEPAPARRVKLDFIAR